MARITRTVKVATTLIGAAVLAAVAPAPATATPVFTCQYVLLTTWSTGFAADLIIKNNGPEINGWTARFSFDAPTQLLGGWQAIMTQQGQTMSGANLPYNGRLPTGQTARFGWTANARVAEIPDDITVNGIPC